MHRCNDCKRDFRNEHDLKSHLSSRYHARSISRPHCGACNKPFSNEQALNDHLRSVHEVTQFRCCDCNRDRDFVTEVALLQHFRDKIHKSKPRAAPRSTNTCDICKKSFNGKDALRQHKASPVHKPICSPIACIGSPECNRTFISPSAMIHHLESSTCLSGLTRHKVNDVIIQYDTTHVVTSRRAIEVAEAVPRSPSSPDDSWTFLTPSSSRISELELSGSWIDLLTGKIASLEDTDTVEAPISASTSAVRSEKVADWNGRLWHMCPLCPSTSNRFKTAEGLQKHSTSLAHAIKIFHCPSGLIDRQTKKSTKAFSTLSGLAMHIESGACHGGRKALHRVLNFVSEMLQNL